MGIQIRNGQRRRRVGRSRLRRGGERTLSVLGRPSDEVSVLLVGDRAIRRLNRAYLNHDHPTDVLAFPQPKSFPLPAPRLLGCDDSTPAARRRMWSTQARLLAISARPLS